MGQTVRLGTRLRYPITVVKLLKSPGDKIRKQEPVLQYSFKWMREVGDTIRGETWNQEQTTIVTWESPTDGELKQWHIREGQRIESDMPCMVVKESCSHGIQFQGLCALCGQDMTDFNWAAETRDTERAPINMVHDQVNLTVSASQAERTEQALQRRLLQSRKLSLVVDLDQTIIQACIDPTVGEWQRDPTNPNHEAVKDVKTFQLDDGPYGLARRCWYYIKLRPGLEAFLRRISEMYELHVYTMGTRAYAQNVARVVDPDKKLFGNRVISRDENGNIYTKSLQRLFPVSTHMVVIIDDRSDVWPRNRPNLIKVSPYEFFKGIGDINSSFLPKRHDLLTSDTGKANGAGKRDKKETVYRNSKNEIAAVESVLDMTGGDESALTQKQLEDQERAFEKQIKDRPLQVLQEKLDREDEEAERATVQSEDGSESQSRSSSPHPHRHRVLHDDDEELKYLEQHLTHLHKTYYDHYDRMQEEMQQASRDSDTMASVPDVGHILEELKSKVLVGCKIVLSGVLPRGVDIYRSEIGLQIMSFGAELCTEVRRDVTHLVVNAMQPGREKLLAARRRPHIKIVSQEWLADCFSRWTLVDETPYLFTARLVDEDEHSTRHGEVVSDEDDMDGDGTPNGRAARRKSPRLKLISASGQTRELGDDDDEDDDDEELDEEGLLPDEIEDGQPSPIDGLRTFNWGSAEEELKEFLASASSDDEDDEDNDEESDEDKEDKGDGDYVQNDDDDDDDEDSTSSDDARRRRGRRSRSGTPSRKRKHHDDDDEQWDEHADSARPPGQHDDESGTQQPQQQAKKLRKTDGSAAGPGPLSALKSQVVPVAAGGSGLPTPRATGDEDGEDVARTGAGGGEVAGDAGAEDEDLVDFDEAELEAEFEAAFNEAEAEGEDAARRATAEGQVSVGGE